LTSLNEKKKTVPRSGEKREGKKKGKKKGGNQRAANFCCPQLTRQERENRKEVRQEKGDKKMGERGPTSPCILSFFQPANKGIGKRKSGGGGGEKRGKGKEEDKPRLSSDHLVSFPKKGEKGGEGKRPEKEGRSKKERKEGGKEGRRVGKKSLKPIQMGWKPPGYDGGKKKGGEKDNRSEEGRRKQKKRRRDDQHSYPFQARQDPHAREKGEKRNKRD